MENLKALQLLKMRQVQALTGLSKSECYAKVDRREWEVVRDGRLIRVPETAIARWIAQHTVPAEDSRAELSTAA